MACGESAQDGGKLRRRRHFVREAALGGIARELGIHRETVGRYVDFAIPELYVFLEAEDYPYAIRLKSKPVLERHVQHLLTRPVGRLPKRPVVRYHEFVGARVERRASDLQAAQKETQTLFD